MNNFFIIQAPPSSNNIAFRNETQHPNNAAPTTESQPSDNNKCNNINTVARQAEEVDSQFQNLSKWVGRYPSTGETLDEVLEENQRVERDGRSSVPPERTADNEGRLQGRSFFRLPEIDRILRTLLPKAEFERLTIEYATESPIGLINDYLLLDRCKPHDCGNQATIVVE